MNFAQRTLQRVAPAGLACALSLGSAAPAHAASPTALERRLEESLRLIDALTHRLEQVEKQLADAKTPAAAPPAAAVSTDARLEVVERTMNQLTAPGNRDLREPGLPLHGFADVGFSHSRRAPPGQRDGFAIGSLDFYLTPEFGANVKTLMELNFGATSDGGTTVDLERMQIGYAFGDALTVWLGRFHTPFGYWNMAYHHGGEIQPSILRPRMLDFEDDGGILPVHTTGAWATGGVRVGPDKLVYNIYVGNGARIADGELSPNPQGDDNRNKAVGLGLNYRFGGKLDGLVLGVNALRQTVGAYDAKDTLTSRTELNLVGGHAAYEMNDWLIVAEYYRMINLDLSSGTGRHGSGAGYLHVGYAFQERWAPYYRFEKASLDQTDKYFMAQANGRSYSRHVVGLRYNLDPRAAVKFELNRTDDKGVGHPTDQFRLQYAIGF